MNSMWRSTRFEEVSHFYNSRKIYKNRRKCIFFVQVYRDSAVYLSYWFWKLGWITDAIHRGFQVRFFALHYGQWRLRQGEEWWATLNLFPSGVFRLNTVASASSRIHSRHPCLIFDAYLIHSMAQRFGKFTKKNFKKTIQNIPGPSCFSCSDSCLRAFSPLHSIHWRELLLLTI